MQQFLNKLRRRISQLRGFGEAFNSDGFRRRETLRDDYRLLAASLLRRLSFDSAYDIGCANGFLLSEFLSNGKRCGGIELSPDVVEVLPEDLRRIVSVGDFSKARGNWELVSCIEVAEHLPAARSDKLVDTCTRIAEKQIFFTAAPPGQSGHGHINCRPMGDWLIRFRQRGWVLDESVTDAVRHDLDSLCEAVWLRGNCVVLAPNCKD